MKKIYLAAMAVLSIHPFVSKAQWTGAPGNIYYNTGKVGIGTVTPVGMFEVNDGNGISPIAYFGANGTANAKGLYFSRPFVNTNPVNIQGTMSGVGAANISLQAEGGYVGIGTTNPVMPLTVNIGTTPFLVCNGNNIGFGSISSNWNTRLSAGALEAYNTNFAFSAKGDGGTSESIVFRTQNTTDLSEQQRMIIAPNGNVGIGTTDPKGRLHVSGKLMAAGNMANIDGENLSYLSNSSAMLIGWNRSGGRGETDFLSNQGLGSLGGFAFYNYDNSNTQSQLMCIEGNGKVGIGTTSPDEKLTVYGKIHSQEVKVDMNMLPDYVFNSDYRLLKLAEVKSYIDKNQHLPDMPSAAEVAKDGLNLGDMNARLLKKVEELTLYLIEKDEKQQKQQKEINELRKQMETLLKKKS